MLAGCGLVNVVCYHVACHTSDTLTSNRTKVSPPQVNDVLTPRACQALLAYTLTLGGPVRCVPLFCNACIVGQVSYRSLCHRSCIGYVTGICYLIGLVQKSFRTLLPNALLAFRVPDQSQCTQTDLKAWAKMTKREEFAYR